MRRMINQSEIEILEGDLTEMNTDVIVNAANVHLQHGGGVAGAIVRKGGMVIQTESNSIGYCPVGEAVITGAGNLKARYVIHTVGPQMGEGNEDEKLARAILNSLKLADKYHLTSIAFPAVSCGIYGFPIERGAKIMIKTAFGYLRGITKIKKVIFCLFGQNSYRIFEEELSKQIPE